MPPKEQLVNGMTKEDIDTKKGSLMEPLVIGARSSHKDNTQRVFTLEEDSQNAWSVEADMIEILGKLKNPTTIDVAFIRMVARACKESPTLKEIFEELADKCEVYLAALGAQGRGAAPTLDLETYEAEIFALIQGVLVCKANAIQTHVVNSSSSDDDEDDGKNTKKEVFITICKAANMCLLPTKKAKQVSFRWSNINATLEHPSPIWSQLIMFYNNHLTYDLGVAMRDVIAKDGSEAEVKAALELVQKKKADSEKKALNKKLDALNIRVQELQRENELLKTQVSSLRKNDRGGGRDKGDRGNPLQRPDRITSQAWGQQPCNHASCPFNKGPKTHTNQACHARKAQYDTVLGVRTILVKNHPNLSKLPEKDVATFDEIEAVRKECENV